MNAITPLQHATALLSAPLRNSAHQRAAEAILACAAIALRTERVSGKKSLALFFSGMVFAGAHAAFPAALGTVATITTVLAGVTRGGTNTFCSKGRRANSAKSYEGKEEYFHALI